jgi:Sulfotransferase domain
MRQAALRRLRRLRFVGCASHHPAALIISYPKSGRTWLRVLLGRSLCLHAGLPAQLLLDTAVLTSVAGAIRTDFDHDGSSLREPLEYTSLPDDKRAYRDKKIIFLARDVRDVLVSSFYEAVKRSLVFERQSCSFDGTLAEFVRSPVFGARKVAAFYEIWARNQTVPKEFLLIRYEQLHRDPEEVLSKVLRFIGADHVEERHRAAAVAYASFENMRELERADAFNDPCLRPGNVTDPDSYKVRRGVVGGYVGHLSADDLAYIEQELRRRGFPLVQDEERRRAE